MINEQIILLMAQTIWLVIFLIMLRDYKDLGMSILMYSVITDAMGHGVWFKWWVYVLLSLFSFTSRVWARFNIVMNQKEQKSVD